MINLYTKCGGILDAYKVFQGLDDPNMVSRYVEYEHDEEDWFASSIRKFMVCLSYWGSVQSSLSNEGFMTSHWLTQDGLGKDSHFLSIYFVFSSWYAF